VRILFLTDDALDYASDPLYVGLSRVLGNDRVVDYPYKRSFHDPEARVWCLAQRPGRRYSREEITDLLRDRAFDVVKGKQTIAVRFGAQWSRREFAALLAIAYLSPFWFWLQLGFGAWILLPLLSIPFAASTARDVFSLDSYEELLPVTPKMGRLLLAYSGLLSIGAVL